LLSTYELPRTFSRAWGGYGQLAHGRGIVRWASQSEPSSNSFTAALVPHSAIPSFHAGIAISTDGTPEKRPDRQASFGSELGLVHRRTAPAGEPALGKPTTSPHASLPQLW